MISSLCCKYRNNSYSVLCCIVIPAAPSGVQCSIMLPDWLILSKYLFFSSRVMTYREHGAWVVKAHLQKEPEGHIISVR